MMSTLQPDILVLDAGVGYGLITYQPERATLRATISGLLEAGCRLAAPTLWLYEVTSILTKAVFQGQLTRKQAEEAVALSRSYPVELIEPSDSLVRAAFQWTLKLKRAAYDSFYLALAQQLQCELWTYDQRLANAVDEPWVRYLGHTEGDSAE